MIRPRGWGGSCVVLVAVSLLILGAAPPARAATKRITPSSHGGAVRLQIGAKKVRYHRATRIKPALYNVTGPTPLRILARDLMPEGTGKVRYLDVKVDDKVIRSLRLKVHPAKDAVVVGGGKAGVLASAVVHVASGRHTVQLIPQEDGPAAAVRVSSGSTKALAIKWVPFAPDSYEKAARLQMKDTEVTCYRFSSSKPIGVSLRGPMRVRVTTRLDFGMANGYTQSYLVRALLNDKPWKSFSLKSKASQTATYPDLGELNPGMAQQFVLQVPGGAHRLTLVLDGTTATGACAQIYVSEKDLKSSQKAGLKANARS